MKNFRKGLRSFKRRIKDWYQFLWLHSHVFERRRIIEEFNTCESIEDIIRFVGRHFDSGIGQKSSEIHGALTAAKSTNPRTICEIGTASGGNSVLLSRWLSTADLMICMDLYVKNKAYINLLAGNSCRTLFLDGSSYHPDTVDKVRRALNGRKIDVLFIDGDHRYEGVKSDFLCYRHLVSEGGLIFFHDIMPDGDDGWLWSGGVPIFWQEVKSFYPYQEFIDDPTQKGFGIGIIHYSSKVSVPFDDYVTEGC